MIKKIILLTLAATTLSGCLGIGSDSMWMSQSEKSQLRENTLKEAASKDISCPVNELEVNWNSSLITKDNQVNPNGFAYAPFDVNGCGVQKTYLLHCNFEDKLEKTPIYGRDVALLTLGTIVPEKLVCNAEPFNTSDVTKAQSKQQNQYGR